MHKSDLEKDLHAWNLPVSLKYSGPHQKEQRPSPTTQLCHLSGI